MTTARTFQGSIEVLALSGAVSKAQIQQVSVDVLGFSGELSTARVQQATLEALGFDGTTSNARVVQASIEAPEIGRPFARVVQLPLEPLVIMGPLRRRFMMTGERIKPLP